MKQSRRTRITLSAAACALLVAACDDRAVVVGEWIITRKGADAGPPDTNAQPLPVPTRGCMTPAPLPRRPVTLPAPELAKRLAWFLWRATSPGDELIRDAMTATDTDAVKALAKTMLIQDRAKLGAMMLARSWLKSDEILTAPKVDPLVTPTALRQRMQLETETFTSSLLTDNASTLTTLLTTSRTFSDEQLAPLYGVTATGPRFMELPPGQRSGVLSHLGMLTARASSPRRGEWVQAALLCLQIPAPPPDAILPPVAAAPGETQRAALERQLRQQPACNGCHSLLDTGYAFEHYDSLGRYRTTDNGVAVNSTTRIIRNTQNESLLVQDVPDMGAKLAQDCEVQQCVARTFLRHGLSREIGIEAEDQSVKELTDAFASGGFQLSDLLLSVTQTQAFLAP